MNTAGEKLDKIMSIMAEVLDSSVEFNEFELQ